MLTTLLDLLGLLLIVFAFVVAVGPAAGMLAAGVCCIVASWRITQARKR